MNLDYQRFPGRCCVKCSPDVLQGFKRATDRSLRVTAAVAWETLAPAKSGYNRGGGRAGGSLAPSNRGGEKGRTPSSLARQSRGRSKGNAPGQPKGRPPTRRRKAR